MQGGQPPAAKPGRVRASIPSQVAPRPAYAFSPRRMRPRARYRPPALPARPLDSGSRGRCWVQSRASARIPLAAAVPRGRCASPRRARRRAGVRSGHGARDRGSARRAAATPHGARSSLREASSTAGACRRVRSPACRPRSRARAPRLPWACARSPCHRRAPRRPARRTASAIDATRTDREGARWRAGRARG